MSRVYEIIDKLRDELQEHIDGVAMTVIGGHLDPSQYKFECGRVSGYQGALRMIQGVIDDMDHQQRRAEGNDNE